MVSIAIKVNVYLFIPLASNAFVTVRVLDINDHVPVLSRDLYEFTIPEDTSVNSRFPLIVATDNDATSNAEITYSIDIGSEWPKPFKISHTSTLFQPCRSISH